jgi:hypothetical protein
MRRMNRPQKWALGVALVLALITGGYAASVWWEAWRTSSTITLLPPSEWQFSTSRAYVSPARGGLLPGPQSRRLGMVELKSW